MAAQAEGLKYGIEHYRRRKPHCSGTLFWQLNDCWPVLSWSVIDYYGFGKAGYYYARRVYDPVLASFQELSGGELALWITNDRLSAVEDRLDVRLVSFDGSTLHSESVDVCIPANSSREVWRGVLEAGNDRFVSVRGERISPNRHFFAAIKDLALQPVAIAVTTRQPDAHTLEVSMSADKLRVLREPIHRLGDYRVRRQFLRPGTGHGAHRHAYGPRARVRRGDAILVRLCDTGM